MMECSQALVSVELLLLQAVEAAASDVARITETPMQQIG